MEKGWNLVLFMGTFGLFRGLKFEMALSSGPGFRRVVTLGEESIRQRAASAVSVSIQPIPYRSLYFYRSYIAAL